jgi:hypothetical protein
MTTTLMRFAPLALAALLQTAPATEPGFTQLFNGKDFTGWKVANPDSFTIQDLAAAMIALGKPFAIYNGGRNQLRKILSLFTLTTYTHEKLVIFQRPNPVFYTLQPWGKRADLLKYLSAEGNIRSQQSQRVFTTNRKLVGTIVQQRKR